MNKYPVTIIAALGLSYSGLMLAQTPDGETPAEESVCDVVNGYGPLHGLCIAYCEAQDCDSLTADTNSCAKILANYDKNKVKWSGPEMPCRAIACPCFDTQSILDAFANTPPSNLNCTPPANIQGNVPCDNANGLCRVVFASQNFIPQGLSCLRYSEVTSPVTELLVPYTGDIAAQDLACVDAIQQAADILGISCLGR